MATTTPLPYRLEELTPELGETARQVGFAIYDLGAFARPELIRETAEQIGLLLCKESIGSVVLTPKQDDPNCLPIHVESVAFPSDEVSPYFILGCIEPAKSGGETLVFDSRRAGDILSEENPGIADTTIIEYSAANHPGMSATRPLIETNSRGEPCLVYRQKVHTNRVVEKPPGLEDDSLYRIIDDVITRCVVVQHQWQPGEIMLVANDCTLHGRRGFTIQPDQGLGRKIVRIRPDDPLHVTYSKF